MDPRRELVAIQIAHTQAQAHDAAILAAATDIITVNVDDVTDVIDSNVMENGKCYDINGHGNGSTVSISGGKENENSHDKLETMSVSTDSVVEDVHSMTPIAISTTTSEVLLTSSCNPRGIKRINLLARATNNNNTVTENNSATNSLQAASVETARTVQFCNIMDVWRGRVQAHAVRLMNTRGDLVTKYLESRCVWCCLSIFHVLFVYILVCIFCVCPYM